MSKNVSLWKLHFQRFVTKKGYTKIGYYMIIKVFYYIYHMLYSTVYWTECGPGQLQPATTITRPQPNSYPICYYMYNFTYCTTMGHHLQVTVNKVTFLMRINTSMCRTHSIPVLQHVTNYCEHCKTVVTIKTLSCNNH